MNHQFSKRRFLLPLTLLMALLASLSLPVSFATPHTAQIASVVNTAADASASPPLQPFLRLGSRLIHPISNTHTAPRSSSVSITYDQNIDPTTVSTRTFAVHAMQTGWLTQTVSVNGGKIKLTPSQPFKPGELVQVSATTGTLNIDGQGPSEPTVWQFRTAAAGGRGTFIDSGQNWGNSPSQGVWLGDVDWDGDLDAFVTNGGAASQVWFNDGTGSFSDSGQSLGSSNSIGIVLGDIDGDSDLDAFVANGFYNGEADKVWLNDGAGHFSDSGQSLGSSKSALVALADVDADGDLDAFVTAYTEGNKVWLNDGTGHFSDSGQSLGSSNSMGIALGDMDGDGDLDAFVANGIYSSGQPNKVWLNDGRGTFTDSGQSLGSSESLGVALGDVDGDGDFDAFVSNGQYHSAKGNKVWLNDGHGTFTDSGQSLGSSRSNHVALGDVDSDGDLDAFISNDSAEANKVWLNDGNGTFTDSGQSLGNSNGRRVALGDVDSDGDLDVFATSYSSPNKVWLNQNPAPQANFTVNPPSGPAPLTVVFTDTSTGPATSWFWDFGDGNSSDQTSPTHTYTETGVYSVSLTVSNSSGSDVITKTNFITVTSMPTISDVRITNVRDSSFTVSWLTDIESTGSIRYGTDPNNLNQTGEDVRGASTSDDTHYVLLDNLLPETTYYFLVVSGDTTDDNAGAHYNVTTGPTLGLPGSDTIYGSVFLTESIPAEGSIVYITLSDADAAGSSREAAPLSALVDHNGFWSINLGNARIADLSSYYSYSANGDTLFLEAQGSADAVGCEKIDTGVDSPARHIVLNVSSCTINKLINLQNGWNHISLPVEPTTMPLTAEEVCNDINAQGGNALEIDRWHASGWEGHICGLPFNNFELLLGSSYFIKSGSQSTWEIEGYQVTEPLSLTLHVGWTSIGIPHTDLYTADTLCDEIIAQGVSAVEIDRWHNGGWQGYICGLPFNQFQIERGVGYFIKSSSAGTVTPSVPQGKRTHLGIREK